MVRNKTRERDMNKVINRISLVSIGIVIGLIYGVVLCGINCESQA